MQPHLGDCIGEPLILKPTRKRHYEHPRWIANGVAAFIGWVAVLLYAVMILIALLVFFANFARTAAASERTYRVPDECRDLLARHGKNYGVPPDAKVLSHDHAFKAWVNLEKKSWWPGVNICLKAVNKTWRF